MTHSRIAELSYPAYIAWQIDLAAISSLDQMISRHRQRRIDKALAALTGAGYTWKFEDVSDEYLDRFVPLYKQHISAKENGTVFDVRQKIQAGRLKGKQHESVSLWHGDTFIGGQIYSVLADALSVAYRVFPYKLPLKLPISCSYVAERQLLTRALALRKTRILHGKDHNVFGPHSAIGLAAYKLNVGCVPHVSTAANNVFDALDNLSLTQDALVFLGATPKQTITEATLFMRGSLALAPEKYPALFAQPRVHVTVELC